jgi:hypothetical protein
MHHAFVCYTLFLTSSTKFKEFCVHIDFSEVIKRLKIFMIKEVARRFCSWIIEIRYKQTNFPSCGKYPTRIYNDICCPGHLFKWIKRCLTKIDAKLYPARILSKSESLSHTCLIPLSFDHRVYISVYIYFTVILKARYFIQPVN